MTEADISYPQQEALTRRFRLGAPRGFVIAPDGSRIAFIRSSGGRDPVGSLWVLERDDSDGLSERLVVDARALLNPDADLPAAEKARRERVRETTAGITAISADHDVRRVVFSLDGIPYTCDLDRDARARELLHPGPVVDPRISPDGTTVVYVHDRALYCVDAAGGSEHRLICAPSSDDESWGLADFVAAEELDRARGLWWLSTSGAVLAELVDESPVDVRWIADASRPDREPTPHRYPSAGTDNPVARLFRVTLDGRQMEVEWDRTAYPYLATVHPDDDGGAVVSVLSRDQQRQLILQVDAQGATSTIRERVAFPWITMQPGVPARGPQGALVEIVANTQADCFELRSDDRPLTPPHLQVTGLVDAEALVVTAQPSPMDQAVYRIGEGGLWPLTRGDGFSSVVHGPGGSVIATVDQERVGTTYDVVLGGRRGQISNLAETPVVCPHVTFERVTDRHLVCALLWPTGHVPGSRRLPVVMAPYGGPHHARVVHAAGAFASDQWLADQGFAVVVVDGAGTPGRGPAWEYEVRGDLARQVLADQVDALQALATTHHDLDLARVGITGWSFGGYLAALAVLDRPDVFHAAVAGAPVTDWALYDTAYTERYLGLPQERPVDYASTSLLPRAERLERPLLLIHGLADDNVLVAHTLQLSAALLAAGRPHSVLPLSGVTHMTPQEVVAENLLRLEVGFLTEHLAGTEG